MSFSRQIVFAVFILGMVFSPFYTTFAAERYTVGTVLTTATFRFNNENWFTMPHPKIVTFTINADGSAYGLTETNVPFSQYNIPNSYGIRIQRFEIQDHYHYIVDGKIAYTPAELSAELAQALQRRDVTS